MLVRMAEGREPLPVALQDSVRLVRRGVTGGEGCVGRRVGPRPIADGLAVTEGRGRQVLGRRRVLQRRPTGKLRPNLLQGLEHLPEIFARHCDITFAVLVCRGALEVHGWRSRRCTLRGLWLG